MICQDGTYRIIPAPDKLLLPAKLLYADVFDPEKGMSFLVAYRDKQRNAFAKRIKIEKFIKGREYELIKGREGRLDLLLPADQQGIIHCDFAKAPRQRVTESDFDLADLGFMSPTARGVRIAPKPVARMRLVR